MNKRFVMKIMVCGLVVTLAGSPLVVKAAEEDEGLETTAVVADESSADEMDDEGYVEVSDPMLIMEQDEAAFEESIGMTDEELLELYNDYLSSTTCSLMSIDDVEEGFSVEKLNGFAEEAAREGIIENNAIQKAAITKAVVRAEFKVVVAGGKKAGYTTAAALLDHSLQDTPSNLSYGSSSSFATQISNSSECTAVVNIFKNQVKGKNISSKTITGSTTLNSTTDLHLAYNKVSYKVVGKKVNGKWNLTITFSDRYDFEAQAWKNSMTDSAAVTIMNNYAAYAQSIGAIVPYDVKVTVTKTY